MGRREYHILISYRLWGVITESEVSYSSEKYHVVYKWEAKFWKINNIKVRPSQLTSQSLTSDRWQVHTKQIHGKRLINDLWQMTENSWQITRWPDSRLKYVGVIIDAPSSIWETCVRWRYSVMDWSWCFVGSIWGVFGRVMLYEVEGRVENTQEVSCHSVQKDSHSCMNFYDVNNQQFQDYLHSPTS